MILRKPTTPTATVGRVASLATRRTVAVGPFRASEGSSDDKVTEAETDSSDSDEIVLPQHEAELTTQDTECTALVCEIAREYSKRILHNTRNTGNGCIRGQT